MAARPTPVGCLGLTGQLRVLRFIRRAIVTFVITIALLGCAAAPQVTKGASNYLQKGSVERIDSEATIFDTTNPTYAHHENHEFAANFSL